MNYQESISCVNHTETSLKYCGRHFSSQEMRQIKEIVYRKGLNRAKISRIVCKKLKWLKADGKLKEMSCRVALLRMEKDGWFTLPPPQKGNGNQTKYRHSNRMGNSHVPIVKSAGNIGSLRIEAVQTKEESELWNEMIHRWHYLGFKKLVGAQIRYLIKSDHGLLGALSFSASAWNVQPREDFIGWNSEVRKENLHLIVNNSRFLILPWIKSKNLASKILAITTRQMPDNWEDRYHYRPVLIETFVEKKRFAGTCYKASNWLYLGETKGRGKLGDCSKLHSNIKYIYVCPLSKNFRNILHVVK